MSKRIVVTGWLASLLLLAGAVGLPRAASAAVCNGLLEINYVGGPPSISQPASPGDTVRVQLVIFTGPITGGALNQMTVNRIRFDLDCSVDFALGLPCTDDGSVIKYLRNVTATNCFDASSNPVTFSDNSGVGNFVPNEVIFTPSAPVVLAHDTPDTSGCVLEFDVQVASLSNDSTPTEAEEVTGFRAITSDATCDNALNSAGSQSSSIPLIAPTPTPTASLTPPNTPTQTATQTQTNTPTRTPTNTRTNTPLLPTSTPTNTRTNTPVTSPTPTNTPSICQGGQAGLIPGYCHSAEINDCVTEFCNPNPPPGENALHPSNSLTCKEGDPACDAGQAGDGICTFRLSLCFNVSDTRISCIAPDKVTRIRLSDPNETHPHSGSDTDNRDALEAALLTLPGATLANTPNRSIVFTPPLTTSDICTPLFPIEVPLRQTNLGPRTRHKAVRYRVFQNPGDRRPIDRDILRLTCTP